MAWELREAGYEPRLQAWHSPPGRNFVDWIRAELAAANAIVVILSPAYLRSKWGGAELNAALHDAVERRRPLVPVRVLPCEAPPLLRELGRINLFERSESEARDALTTGMRAAAVGTGTAPTLAPPYPGAPGNGASGPPPFPGPDPEALHESLLDRVEQAARQRYPDAMISPRGTRAAPYLDVDGRRDEERQRWPVAVSLDTPSAASIEEFHTKIVRDYLRADEFVESELVFQGTPPGEDVRTSARRLRVRLFGPPRYEGRWDPRDYLARQARKLAADPVYPPELYVPQRFTVSGGAVAPMLTGGRPLPEPEIQSDVFRAMCDWLDVEEARFLLVLGPPNPLRERGGARSWPGRRRS